MGFGVAAQHTPLAVTGEPPSVMISPPPIAVEVVMADKVVVVMTGAIANVVNIA